MGSGVGLAINVNVGAGVGIRVGEGDGVICCLVQALFRKMHVTIVRL